jgi:hypothetical protein
MNSIHPSFIIFEILVYILFIACLIDAWKREFGHVTELIGALLFGLLLEYINANYLVDYGYGRFLVMIGNIPLAVGAGWAIIIYSSMAISDRFGFSLKTRPFVDAFLALNIDLSMDAIAVRLGGGMWIWGWADQSLRWTSEWFGVPFGNFFGWFFVVLLYSGTVRLGRLMTHLYRFNLKWKSTYPILCVLTSELLLTGLVIVFTLLWQKGIPSWLLLLLPVLISAMMIILMGKPKPGDDPSGIIMHAVPLAFHCYFLISLFIFKITAWTPWLVVISLSMLSAGIAVQILAFRSKNRNRIVIS